MHAWDMNRWIDFLTKEGRKEGRTERSRGDESSGFPDVRLPAGSRGGWRFFGWEEGKGFWLVGWFGWTRCCTAGASPVAGGDFFDSLRRQGGKGSVLV